MSIKPKRNIERQSEGKSENEIKKVRKGRWSGDIIWAGMDCKI